MDMNCTAIADKTLYAARKECTSANGYTVCFDSGGLYFMRILWNCLVICGMNVQRITTVSINYTNCWSSVVYLAILKGLA